MTREKMATVETSQIQVPWHKLAAWVQQQMAAEMQTGHPVTLTRSQLEALSHLIPFNEEPDVSDKDYVSLLLQKTQARRLTAPVFADLPPVSVPIDGHFEPRWQCSCTVELHGEFPRLGFGCSAGRQTPLFQSKKNAKQFAAKQALEFLSRYPGTASQPRLPLKKRLSIPLAPPSMESPAQIRALDYLPATPPVSLGDLAPSSQLSSRKSSVFEQVSVLTGRLGMDSPRYLVEQDPAGGEYFCGRPVFKNGGRAPLDLGIVSGVQGQAQTKLRIAEEVLAWAEGELQKRQDMFQSLWGAATLSGPKVPI